jgi:hypothetical protein
VAIVLFDGGDGPDLAVTGKSTPAEAFLFFSGE